MSRSLKIALVHMKHAGTGGTERYLNQISKYLAERGHEVTIVCRTHEEPSHPALHFVVLKSPALKGSWRNWAFARDVERHVRESGYDIVYGLGKTWTHDVTRLGGGTHAQYLELAHAATLRPFERPFAQLAHLSVRHWVSNRIQAKGLAPGAYRRIIANSEMVKRDVVQRYHVPPDKVTVLYNAVDADRFNPRLKEGPGARLRAELGFSSDQRVILFLGSNYGRKGLEPLLEAFAILARERPDARLMVVGYDSRIREFEGKAAKLGVGGLVRFLGGRRDPEACYAAADVYALPTHYDPVAFSVLEAMASGLPAIGSAQCGAAEIITEQSGTVVGTPADIAGLTAALRRWIDPESARAGGQAARAIAEQLTESHMMEKAADLLERVAQEKRAAKAG